MAVTYEWVITSIKKAPSLNGLTDVVTKINFDYIGTDSEDNTSGTFHGAVTLGSPDAENFTSLSDLTEDQVIEWVKPLHETTHMEHVIGKQIEFQKTPMFVEVDNLPWDPVEEEPVAEETTEEQPLPPAEEPTEETTEETTE